MIELVRVIRSGFHEGSHYGSVVITDPDGAVVVAVGTVDEPIYPRSSNKPFQAIAALEAGADLGGADSADLALAAASHSGELMHTDRVQAMLDRSGFTEDDLQCPPAMPLNDARRQDIVRAGGGPRRIYMNCSGKHTGMIMASRAAGWDPGTYLQPDHPYQRSVLSRIAELTGETPSATGVDGCGAPVVAFSLTGLARAFGRLTTAPAGSPTRTVADAMRAHPEMVGGTGRDDTLLMQAIPGLLLKAGAEGVHAAALPDGRALALKISDGAERARTVTLVAALRQLGVDDPVLDELGTSVVLGGGVAVGLVEPAPGLFHGS